MNQTLWWLALVLVVLAAALWVGAVHLRRRAQPPMARATDTPEPAGQAAESAEPVFAAAFQLATAIGEPPVLTAAALDAETFDRVRSGARPLNTRSGGISRLSPLLQAVRLSAAEARPPEPAAEAVRYLKVVVDGRLARSAEGKRFCAFVLDREGRIIDPARLSDAGRLKFGFGGTLLFQAVSVMVAQQQLKDIHAQLGRIMQGVDCIQQFLGRERRHAVLAIIDAMAQRIPEMQAGVLDPQWPPQLHANDQELARIQGHVREEVQSAVAALKEITTGFWGAAEQRQAQIEDRIQRTERCLAEWQLATEARILGWKLLVAFPGVPALQLERRRAIEREIALLHADGGLLAQFDLGVREQIAKIQRLLRRADASRRRGLLAGQQDERRERLGRQQASLSAAIVAVVAAQRQQDAALHVAVKLDDQDIVEAWELPGAEADTSPAEANTSPAEADTSPAEADTSPAEADTSPAEADTSPAEADTSLAEADTSPAEADTSPAEADTSPSEADRRVPS